MAFDLLRGTTDGRDWSIGVGDEPDESIPWLVGPSDANRIVDKAVAEEQAAVEELSRAKAEGKIDDATWRNFNVYHNEFHTWLKSTGKRPYGKLKLGTEGIYTTAFEHRKRIKDWRKLGEQKGAELLAPHAKGVGEKEKPNDKGGLWKWLAIAGAGALSFSIIVRKIGN